MSFVQFASSIKILFLAVSWFLPPFNKASQLFNGKTIRHKYVLYATIDSDGPLLPTPLLALSDKIDYVRSDEQKTTLPLLLRSHLKSTVAEHFDRFMNAQTSTLLIKEK